MVKMQESYSPKTNCVAMYEDPNTILKATACISDQRFLAPVNESIFASVTG
jgi:hypothetical protein